MATKPKPVVFTVAENGCLISEWWDKETAEIICALCQECPGWESDARRIDCPNQSKYCG